VVLLLAAPAAHAGSWLRPVDGPVLRAFALGADPYARGQHRGVDLGAAPGSPVRGVCAGRVGFAGRVPAGGRTVSVRCGEIVATYQQLGTIVVRVGQRIAAGAAVGLVGRSGDPRTRRPHLHLGAREAATGRYVDPLTLLRTAPPAVSPLAPTGSRRSPIDAPLRAPAPRLARAVPLGHVPAPGLARALPGAVALGTAPVPGLAREVPLGHVPAPGLARAVPREVPLGHVPAPLARALPGAFPPPADSSPAPAPGLPWVVWIGLASIGLALPVGGIVGVRRRRRATSGQAVAASR
jgi:hypothetical protein